MRQTDNPSRISRLFTKALASIAPGTHPSLRSSPLSGFSAFSPKLKMLRVFSRSLVAALPAPIQLSVPSISSSSRSISFRTFSTQKPVVQAAEVKSKGWSCRPVLEQLSLSFRLLGLLSSFQVIIDVREADEFASGHLPQAINIPLGQLMRDAKKDILQQHRGQKILCVCRSGGRSDVATQVLNNNGLDATNLGGGMLEWQSS